MTTALGAYRALLVVWLLACTGRTPACRPGRPRSDLSARESLVNEILISPSDGSCMSSQSGTDEYGKILSSHDESKSQDIFNVSIICAYVIKARPPFERVMLDFRWFDVSQRYFADLVCEHASVTFYDGPDTMTSPILRDTTCGSQRPQLITSSQSSLSMQIYASGNLSVIDFMAVYSSFSDDTFCNITEESEPRLLCASTSRCIPKALSCDRQGVSNCGDEDYSDQVDEVAPSFCPVTYDIDWTPLIISVACIAGLAIPLLLYWCCWRPGYIPWLGGACRRARCCELGGCCTTPSRHLCRGACSCRGCAGCSCVCCPGAVEPQHGNASSRGTERQRKPGRADPTPDKAEGGHHDVNSPNNVVLVVDDGQGQSIKKGGKPKYASGRQQIIPNQLKEDRKSHLNNESVPATSDGKNRQSHPGTDNANTSTNLLGKSKDAASGSSDSAAGKTNSSGSNPNKNPPSKVHFKLVSESSETTRPSQVRSGFHWDPRRYYPSLNQEDRTAPHPGAVWAGSMDKHKPPFTKAYTDGGHVREGR